MLDLNIPRLSNPPEHDENTSDASTMSCVGKILRDSNDSTLERSLAATSNSAIAKHFAKVNESRDENHHLDVRVVPNASSKFETNFQETPEPEETTESIIKYVGDTIEDDLIDLLSLPSTPRVDCDNITIQDVSVICNSRCNNRPKRPPVRDISQNSFVDDFYISHHGKSKDKKRHDFASALSSSAAESNQKILPKRYQKYVDIENYSPSRICDSNNSDSRMYRTDAKFSESSDSVSAHNTMLANVASHGSVATTSPQRMYSDIGRQLADQIKKYFFTHHSCVIVQI